MATSTTQLRFIRLVVAKIALLFKVGAMFAFICDSRNASGRVGDSILITSAPIEASHRVQCGPETKWVKSTTRIPSSGNIGYLDPELGGAATGRPGVPGRVTTRSPTTVDVRNPRELNALAPSRSWPSSTGAQGIRKPWQR